MTPEQLREAAELSGLEVTSGGLVIIEQPQGIPFTLSITAPVVPAYIAELLAGKVRETECVMTISTGIPTPQESSVVIQTDPAAPGWKTLALINHSNTTTAIIVAAMRALTGNPRWPE